MAQARYDDVRTGRVAFEGGRRVYSSGAGIAVRLIHECFLGLRRARATLTIDPAIPPELDGLRADVELAGRRVGVLYRCAGRHRAGGVAVSMTAIADRIVPEDNELVIALD
ncbi:MAG TPA: hypothetical protein VN945_08280 [Gemmatimonadales bacterium]|nr:hypothetical protein [Gemmatimonadales bacterium]